MSQPPEPPADWAAWAAAFAAGELVDPAVPDSAGERVAVRLNDAVVAAFEDGPRPQVVQLFYRGPLVITDRRILAAGPGGTQWPWSDFMSHAVIEPHGWGTVFLPTAEAIGRGARRWGILNPAVLDPTPPAPAELESLRPAWDRVVAAWQAGQALRHVDAQSRPQPPLNLQQLSRAQRKAIKALLTLRRTFVTGGRSKHGLFQPGDYAADERLLVSVPYMARGRLFAPHDRARTLHREYVRNPDKVMNHVEGRLFVTDRRAVLIGNRRKVVAEWLWRDLSDVQMIAPWAGIHFVGAIGELDVNAALYVYRPYLRFQPSGQKVAIWLLQALGGYVLSSGQDYDAWLASLPAKWT